MTAPTGPMRTWGVKVIEINGERSGRQHTLSKSGIVGNEPKISKATGDQKTPGPVQELIKVLTAALQAERKKISSEKGKLPNKQVGAGSAQITTSAGNTQVKGRVDRASALTVINVQELAILHESVHLKSI